MKKLLAPIATQIGSALESIRIEEERMGYLSQDILPDQETRDRVKGSVGTALDLASTLTLKTTSLKCKKFMFSLGYGVYMVSEIKDRLRVIRETFSEELGVKLFLTATDDMVEYLDKESPFGKRVSEIFPECSEDISEAHQCFAFERYTATAFHISRAMEIVVRRVAKKMGAKAHRDEWQSYITAMNEAIQKMPWKSAKDKAKRAIYAEAAHYLFNFKEAFRNKTMHPKKTYTRTQALGVLESAGSFLNLVADRLFRRPTKRSL